VRGRENLPTHGAYIIASKHQSEYETLKAHLLFNDPAIILKKELLRIPFFGAYLSKAGVLAIDRSTPERALRSIQTGALIVREQGRPLLIFPQGTRVSPDQSAKDKPYKPGIVRVQDVTQLPIVPMALNSGVFWPKNSWLKSSGTVIFDIMPPIQPGHNRANLMSTLQDLIETRSDALAAEARTQHNSPAKNGIHKTIKTIMLIALFCIAYAGWWTLAARWINESYLDLWPIRPEHYVAAPLNITGFPIMTASSGEEIFTSGDGTLQLTDVAVSGWPVPGLSSHIKTGTLTVTSSRWRDALRFDQFDGYIVPGTTTIIIRDAHLQKDTFKAVINGTVKTGADIPQVDLNIQFQNYTEFIKTLAQNGIFEQRTAQFMIAAFNALADSTGVVSIPITQNGRTLYAGPFAIAKLPEPSQAIERSFQQAPADPQVPSH
jgi:1-acyl-sn-glycerol-3-phosphate acyltransferase